MKTSCKVEQGSPVVLCCDHNPECKKLDVETTSAPEFFIRTQENLKNYNDELFERWTARARTRDIDRLNDGDGLGDLSKEIAAICVETDCGEKFRLIEHVKTASSPPTGLLVA
ncbi:hypothetical protein RclHR1_07990001 [Rhizophagus clarus]|uniref:Uncharacterized protein n=1 Tax=Rhizophagus clarus TaxID=94130 RepID=A0A2Z6SM98_9GLOM|nr:hypothetical protein RclHR1_07990001 [Rhizophagus clarus]